MMNTQKLDVGALATGEKTAAPMLDFNKRSVKPKGRGGRAGSETHRVKRGAFERMKRICGWLQEGKYPNCSSIAAEFEVARKTAARDLEFMRDRWGLPIEYDSRRMGYYFTETVERLPWVPVTEAELFAVCISGKVLESYRGMPFQKPLELAFAKITRGLDDEERYMLENMDLAFSFRPFAAEDPDLRLLEVLTRAVAGRQSVSFGYRKPAQKEPELRTVDPYHVMEFEGRLYLLAFDPARGAVRKFVLARMSDLEVTGERFVRPKDFDPKQEFGTSLGVMSGEGDYAVVIEMDAWLTDVLRGRRWHPSQEVVELPGGGSHLRMRLSCLEEIEQYVLSWGTHATCVGPMELRERIRGTVEKLEKRYGDLEGVREGRDSGELVN